VTFTYNPISHVQFVRQSYGSLDLHTTLYESSHFVITWCEVLYMIFTFIHSSWHLRSTPWVMYSSWDHIHCDFCLKLHESCTINKTCIKSVRFTCNSKSHHTYSSHVEMALLCVEFVIFTWRIDSVIFTNSFCLKLIV